MKPRSVKYFSRKIGVNYSKGLEHAFTNFGKLQPPTDVGSFSQIDLFGLFTTLGVSFIDPSMDNQSNSENFNKTSI